MEESIEIYSFTLSQGAVSVVFKIGDTFKPMTKTGVTKELLELLKEPSINASKVFTIMSPPAEIVKNLGDGFTEKSGEVFYGDYKLPNVLTERLLFYVKSGIGVQRFKNFVTNLLQNPSRTAIQELILFLECGEFTLTEDGHLLAYKSVNENYTDCHTGKVDNSVGQKPWMPRIDVDDDRNNLCSYGYHFCSFNYVGQFRWDRYMLVKVDPKDVVSIPSDYNNAKARCNTYEVVAEITEEVKAAQACILRDYNSEREQTIEWYDFDDT